MAKSIQEWISEGEGLHSAALSQLQELEAQIADLEQKRSAQLAEVTQIASIIGKQAPESARRVVAGIVEEPPMPASHASSATIARALVGKGLGR